MAIQQISFDATKLDKSKMRDGKWVELEKFDLKERKIKTKQDGTPIQGDGWTLMKVGFVKQKGEKGAEMPIIGEVVEFDRESGSTGQTEGNKEVSMGLSEDDIDVSDIPF